MIRTIPAAIIRERRLRQEPLAESFLTLWVTTLELLFGKLRQVKRAGQRPLSKREKSKAAVLLVFKLGWNHGAIRPLG